MQDKLHGVHQQLELIGLHLATHKCQMIASPHFPEPQVLQPNSSPVQVVASFVFLGILIGFAVSPEQTLSNACSLSGLITASSRPVVQPLQTALCY